MKHHHCLQQALASVTPLTMEGATDEMAVRIVNIVASVHILNHNETLSVPNILIKARGAAKYTPKSFQAVILRTGDGGPASNVTALVYPNGKMNIVGAINFEHARAYAQQYRLFIEDALQLEGSTCFTNFKVYNTVCASRLGFRPNLSRLQALYPLASEWEPELFPGLRLQVWLKPKSACTCVRKKNNYGDSCSCNATCLLFDTGKIIATGLHDYKDAPLVCDCVRLFVCGRTDLQDKSAEVPRHLRWDHRKMQKLAAIEIDFIGTCKPRPELQPESAEQILDKTRVKRPKTVADDSELAPIFQACDAGDLDMVPKALFAMSIDPACVTVQDKEGRTALERVIARKASYAEPSLWSELVSLLGGDEGLEQQ